MPQNAPLAPVVDFDTYLVLDASRNAAFIPKRTKLTPTAAKSSKTFRPASTIARCGSSHSTPPKAGLGM
jgi:hypothetical protein